MSDIEQISIDFIAGLEETARLLEAHEPIDAPELCAERLRLSATIFRRAIYAKFEEMDDVDCLIAKMENWDVLPGGTYKPGLKRLLSVVLHRHAQELKLARASVNDALECAAKECDAADRAYSDDGSQVGRTTGQQRDRAAAGIAAQDLARRIRAMKVKSGDL